MKRIFAILALLGAVSIGAPAWAEENLQQRLQPQRRWPHQPPPMPPAQHRPSAAAPAPVANKGDNAWVMTSAALVILMSIPGLALFYGGLVRTKNMLSVLMQVFVTFSLISVLWVVYGYSWPLPKAGASSGCSTRSSSRESRRLGRATFSKGVVISELAFVIFQGAFAAITCGLIVGAFAERAKFAAILVFMVIWFTLSYLPMAHMVWYWAGPDAYIDAAAGEAAGKTAGFLFQKGALDFAGGTVVHINAAVAGLVGAIVIGKRIGYGRESMAPHSLTFTMIGASLLWFGWFGFNAGSALEASGGAALAMVNTWVATAVRRCPGCWPNGCSRASPRCSAQLPERWPAWWRSPRRRRFRRRRRRHRHRPAGRCGLPVGRQWSEATARRRRFARRLWRAWRRRHPRCHPDRRLRGSGAWRHRRL
jgi:Amt family ammonium transporter